MFRSIMSRMESVVKKLQEESKVYNPLNIHIGSSVQVDKIDFRGKTYRVRGVRENVRHITGRTFSFVDYDLVEVGPSNPEQLRLRANPVADGSYVLLLLKLYYECGYQEAQETGLEGSVGEEEFKITWGEKERRYWRIEGKLRTPYRSNVKVLEDLNSNGMVGEDEVRNTSVDYWDYHAEMKDEIGYPYTEYVFVEKNPSDGFWQIWYGSEVLPDRVQVLS